MCVVCVMFVSASECLSVNEVYVCVVLCMCVSANVCVYVCWECRVLYMCVLCICVSVSV